MRKLLQMTMIVFLPAVLSSCAVYSTGFSCPDSIGAKCVMLSQVDQMVDSGEIETVYMDKKCKGGKCKNNVNVPRRSLNEIHRIKIEQAHDARDIQYLEGDYLYVR